MIAVNLVTSAAVDLAAIDVDFAANEFAATAEDDESARLSMAARLPLFDR